MFPTHPRIPEIMMSCHQYIYILQSVIECSIYLLVPFAAYSRPVDSVKNRLVRAAYWENWIMLKKTNQAMTVLINERFVQKYLLKDCEYTI
jgi:hypothetical protein